MKKKCIVSVVAMVVAVGCMVQPFSVSAATYESDDETLSPLTELKVDGFYAEENSCVDSSVGFMSDDEILLLTGMSLEEINALDSDIKAYIANDLRKSNELSDITYITLEEDIMPTPRVNQVLSGITFDALAFKSGDSVHIYPTYEFTTNKKPAGNDSFSFQLGDAFMPYEYGGQLWCKDDTMSNWEVVDPLVANAQGPNGAEFSGTQLGSPDWSMKLKGCTYVYAKVGSGTDKRIFMSYMYNPHKYSYNISFSYKGFGIQYNSANTIYTAAKTIFLSY